MSPSFLIQLSMSTVLAISCIALQILEEGHSRDIEERTLQTLPAPAQSLAMALPANLSTESVDIDNRLIRCDTAFGSGLTAGSCNNVLALSPTSAGLESWGYLDELPAGTTVDEDLPLKLWSGKKSGSALNTFLACGFLSMLI